MLLVFILPLMGVARFTTEPGGEPLKSPHPPAGDLLAASGAPPSPQGGGKQRVADSGRIR